MVKNLKVEYNKEIIEKFKSIHIAADHIGSVLFVLLALDEERIDLLDTIDDENKARRMLLLYRQLDKRNLITPGKEQLYALTEEGKSLIMYIRSQFEIIQEEINVNNFQSFVSHIVEKRDEVIKELLPLVTEYNNTFPKIKRNNTKVLCDRMNDFIKQFDYSPEIIIEASKMYNKHCDNEGIALQYRRFAQYFIYEGKGSSRTWDLATWCDKFIETKDNIENQHNLQQFDIL